MPLTSTKTSKQISAGAFAPTSLDDIAPDIHAVAQKYSYAFSDVRTIRLAEKGRPLFAWGGLYWSVAVVTGSFRAA
jgi:hypothetical protein